ncbi:hypothetical protein PG294_08330 [Riemerella anatipestifer]|uniref:hypothetical protein n=1 Tax=Riemerella anatipestifer TaxID=34085 RepID=UPI0012AE10ED|nr:hypothetical protein [Riemerella anatipestifer]MCQ4155607.1 hypothetical protein [Riemerella anatipestifer]MDR7775704.1 hypothetical protein [Riemerella anatipestifer]MDR7784316.1 hypothetical protein [Riemerella anatipestifer]MDY3347363.1 hypothetical protein [Riemerella anatipestifer]MDY3349684.1 hypothetical protein [Riemerella anatipestifer]
MFFSFHNAQRVGTIFGVVLIPGLYLIFGKIAGKNELAEYEDLNPLTEEIEDEN